MYVKLARCSANYGYELDTVFQITQGACRYKVLKRFNYKENKWKTKRYDNEIDLGYSLAFPFGTDHKENFSLNGVKKYTRHLHYNMRICMLN